MQKWLLVPFDQAFLERLFPKFKDDSEKSKEFDCDLIKKTDFETEKTAHVNRYRLFLQKNQFYSNEFKLSDHSFEVLKNEEVNFDFYSASTKIGNKNNFQIL